MGGGSERRYVVFFLLFFVFCSVSHAYGSGFAIYTQSASALGQANAVTAHADDPGAVFFNPALINKLEGTQIKAGTTLLFPSRTFKSDFSGKTFKAKGDLFYPSTFFATHAFNEKISAGLGVFSPFGLASNWGTDWEGRYIATHSELHTLNINPAVSYRLTPVVTVAAGLDVLLLDAMLEKNINLSALGLPDAGQKFKGEGNGAGYNLGILFDLNKDVSVGASYRSGIKIGMHGRASHALPAGAPPAVRALFPDTDAKADLNLPQQFHAGICYKGFSPLTIEVGMRWEGWSSLRQLRIDLDTPVAGSASSITEKKWRDVYSVNTGLTYRVNDSVSLLAGYLYGGNPAPDATFDPTLPDADAHIFSIGTNVKFRKIAFDLAYGFQKLKGRSKNNAVDDNPADGIVNPATTANGKYNTHVHMIGGGLTWTF